jgi:hypothetical protein
LQVLQTINNSTSPKITGLQITDVLCYGDTTGTAQITGVLPAVPYAPYQIQWSNGDTGVFSDRFSKVQHYVVLTDTNGCVAAQYFNINQPQPLEAVAANIVHPSCYGGSDGKISIEGKGGAGYYRYQWSIGDTASNIANLPQGSYHIKLNDANGCLATNDVTLIQPDTIIIGDENSITQDTNAVIGIVATKIENDAATPLVFYPNPTTGIVYIKNMNTGQAVKVYSEIGVLLLRTRKKAVNLSKYPSGIYWLQVGKTTAKIIKL